MKKSIFYLDLLVVICFMFFKCAHAFQKENQEVDKCSYFSEKPGRCFRVPEFSSRDGDRWSHLDLSYSKFREGGFIRFRWLSVSGEGLDARGARFFSGQWDRVTFDKSVFIGSVFQQCSFLNSSMIHSNLNGVKMSHVVFKGGSLRGSTFKGALIKDSKFDDIEISRSSFKKAQCIQCDLRGVKWLP